MVSLDSDTIKKSYWNIRFSSGNGKEEEPVEQIAEVIKYEGDNSTFIWKHPCEDFNSLTQLIVHESQEAIFFMNGQALDMFGAGRYTLETQNIPKIGKILNRTTDKQTPFHCEVYFINKTEQMSIKWGTDSKVTYVEPTYGFPIAIGASGEMSLRAEDSRKLLLKLVGTENFLGQQKLVSFFRACKSKSPDIVRKVSDGRCGKSAFPCDNSRSKGRLQKSV